MLCSPDLDQPSGQCVFMVVPNRPDLFETPAASLLFQRRDPESGKIAECEWHVTSREPLSIVVRTPGLTAELFVELNRSGIGEWGFGSGVARQVVGRAEVPSQNT
jgi:hypothetical protein